jgi:hypothetical protein
VNDGDVNNISVNKNNVRDVNVSYDNNTKNNKNNKDNSVTTKQ